MKNSFPLFFLMFFSLLFSCGEFTAVEEADARNVGLVALSVFKEGKVLKPGDPIDYAFSFLEEETDAAFLRIDLIDLMSEERVAAGAPVALADLNADIQLPVAEKEAGSQPIVSEETDGEKASALQEKASEENDYDYHGRTVVPSGLTDGYYAFEFSWLDGENHSVEVVRNAFFISSLALKVQSVGSYPSVIYPGGECLLYAEIAAPAGFDSDVVWSCNGVEIYRNRLKEMPPAVKWRAPENKTAVEMTVGIYPSDPPVGEVFPFFPPVSLTSTMFISANQPIESGDFRPDSAYEVLFHFRGETKDFAPSAATRTVTVEGAPQLMLDSQVFGYAFTDGSSVSTMTGSDVFIGEDGERRPLAFDFRFNLKSPDSGQIFSMTDSSGKGGLAFSKEGDRINVRIDAEQPFSQTLNLSRYTKTDLTRLSFFVFGNPSGQKLSFVWGIDGYPVSRSVIDYGEMPSPSEYMITIGGKNGYGGVIDEVGIFKIEDRETDSLFAETLKRRFGEAVLFADDFVCRADETVYSRFPESEVTGQITVASGEVLKTAAHAVPAKSFSVQFTVPEGDFPGGCIEILDVAVDEKTKALSESVAVTLNLTDKTFSAAEDSAPFSFAGTPCGLYQLDFEKKSLGWTVRFGDRVFPIVFTDGHSVAVSVSAGNGVSLTLDNLVILGVCAVQADLYTSLVSVDWQP